MTPGWHKVIVAASLHNVGDRSAIYLKIQNYIPAKVRRPQNNKTPTRLGGGPIDAMQTKMKMRTIVAAEVYLGFMG